MHKHNMEYADRAEINAAHCPVQETVGMFFLLNYV